MYIPRPAKLLFQHDEGWSNYLDKHGDSLSDWTELAVECMLACDICAMGVRRNCCASPDCIHARFFCPSSKSKACSSCGLKTALSH
ncbi:TPA: transposase zinc-binding domain-containing protein [Serratia marcescens]